LLKLKLNLKKVGYSFLSVIEFDKDILAGSSSKQYISLTYVVYNYCSP